MTQDDLAAAAGYPRQNAISVIERNQAPNTPGWRLTDIAQALRVVVGWLYGEGPDDLYDGAATAGWEEDSVTSEDASRKERVRQRLQALGYRDPTDVPDVELLERLTTVIESDRRQRGRWWGERDGDGQEDMEAGETGRGGRP